MLNYQSTAARYGGVLGLAKVLLHIVRAASAVFLNQNQHEIFRIFLNGDWFAFFSRMVVIGVVSRVVIRVKIMETVDVSGAFLSTTHAYTLLILVCI